MLFEPAMPVKWRECCCAPRDDIWYSSMSLESQRSVGAIGEESESVARRVCDAHRSRARAQGYCVDLEELFAEHSNNSTAVTDVYNFDGNLGKGTFGQVMQAHLKTCPSVKRAVKQVKRGSLEQDAMVRCEVGILRLLDHPAIVKIHETFHDSDSIFLVMECIEGRELLDEIQESISAKTHNNERCTCIMRQVFAGLQYMHSEDVIHRDLKPDNIMIIENAGGKFQDPMVKIIDFGLAVLADNVRDFKSKRVEGTVRYLAPEAQAKHHFSAASDMWSIGIIIFLMNLHCFPMPWNVQLQIQDIHDPDARDIVSRLLAEHPQNRLTAAEAVLHPWVAKDVEATSAGIPRPSSLHHVIESCGEVDRTDCLQRAAYTALASHMSGQQLETFWEPFALLEKGDDLTDVRALVDRVFKELELDSSGVLEFTEWVAAIHSSDQGHMPSAARGCLPRKVAEGQLKQGGC